MFHYSWTANRQQKFQKLAQFDMIYLDPNDIPDDIAPGVAQSPAAKDSTPSGSGEVVSEQCTLTLHLIDQDPVEIVCDPNSFLVHSLLRALRDSEAGEAENAVIHLRLEQDSAPYDLFLRGSQISRIEVTPPLSNAALYRLHRASRKRNPLRRFLEAAKRRAARRPATEQ